MAIGIGANFNYLGEEPNFSRDRFATVAEMEAAGAAKQLDEGHICYIIEEDKHYKWNGTSAEALANSDTYYLELPVDENGQCLFEGELSQEQVEQIFTCKTLVVRVNYIEYEESYITEDIIFNSSFFQQEVSEDGTFKAQANSAVSLSTFDSCYVSYILLIVDNTYQILKKRILINDDISDLSDARLLTTYVLRVSSDSGFLSEEEFNNALNADVLVFIYELDGVTHKVVFTQRTDPAVYPNIHYFYSTFSDGGMQGCGLTLMPSEDNGFIFITQISSLVPSATQHRDGLMSSADKQKLDTLDQGTITNSKDSSTSLKMWS